jgi:hypothetical protein
MFSVFMVKSIMFSIEPITECSKSAGPEAQGSQQWASITHFRGSGL